jgi:SAM-dependent methyltransferase
MQAQFDPDSAAAWQVRIFKKSAPRKAMLEEIQRCMPPTEGKQCVDIGGRDGMIPTMLRKRGGTWQSADSREAAVDFMQEVFGEDHVRHLPDSTLPYEDKSLDLIVVMEHLERIRDDAGFLKECHRCLVPGGCLILHVPHVKSFSLVHGLRSVLGLTDEAYGRIRPGYRLRNLYDISKNGYDIVESRTYGGFLEEFVETWIVKATGGAASEEPETIPEPGVVPDQQVLRDYARRYRIHACLYPVVMVCRGIDRLFRFTCNHHLVVQLKPRPWIERRGVQMRDGRSIADATINTKIGSAADLTDPKNNRSSP